MQTFTIPITGVSGGGCVSNVRNALLRIPGVKDAHRKARAATVTCEQAAG